MKVKITQSEIWEIDGDVNLTEIQEALLLDIQYNQNFKHELIIGSFQYTPIELIDCKVEPND